MNDKSNRMEKRSWFYGFHKDSIRKEWDLLPRLTILDGPNSTGFLIGWLIFAWHISKIKNK